MTGIEFERFMAKVLADQGHWVLTIPRNEAGAQPFDILAIRGREILAVDCKVCEADTFPTSRIEPNQWTAFKTVWERVSAFRLGLFVLHGKSVYFFDYPHLLCCRAAKSKSVDFEVGRIFLKDVNEWM